MMADKHERSLTRGRRRRREGLKTSTAPPHFNQPLADPVYSHTVPAKPPARPPFGLSFGNVWFGNVWRH
jgi:hypothetical protein